MARRRIHYFPDNLPRPAHWSADAACREADPDLFYAEGDTGTALLETAEAKRFCARCPVREPCLAEALERGERHGVWGGLDTAERRTVTRRARERAASQQKETGDAATAEPANAPAA